MSRRWLATTAVLCGLTGMLTAQAEAPVPGVDPPVFAFSVDSPEFLPQLGLAEQTCRQSYCNKFLEVLGNTRDGETVRFWIGHWFVDPTQTPFRLWGEVVYVDFWTGEGPYVDYTAGSMVVHGINFWNFTDKLLAAVGTNENTVVKVQAPGWYAVHLDDTYPDLQEGAEAEVTMTAHVRRDPRGTHGTVLIDVKARLLGQ